jgi:hypothetical protein
VQLNAQDNASIAHRDEDVFVYYQEGADWPGWFLEGVPFGGRATSFHETFWGYVYVCPQSSTGDPISVMDQPSMDTVSDAFRQHGEVRGWLADLEPQMRDLPDFRRVIVPNLFGDVEYDFDEWGDSGIPMLKADHVWHNDPEMAFDDVGFNVGPDAYFAETFRSESTTTAP